MKPFRLIRHPLLVLSLYAVLLLASRAVEHTQKQEAHAPALGESITSAVPQIITLQAVDANGFIDDTTADLSGSSAVRMAVHRWGNASADRPTVVLLHGSPGSGDNFDRLGPLLAQAGYAVIAPDLPGFGQSELDLPDYGSRAHARYVLQMLELLNIQRAHVVGWSNGGAVGLNMADLQPDRLATLTMLASVGAQQTEGSGSYHFEQAKYKVGLAIYGVLEHLTPHFGLVDDHANAWLLNFDHTDQRPLEAVMAKLTTPTLILHGRDDFLTSAWAAEHHHSLMPSSRLVMLDSDHFMPFMQADEATRWLTEHFTRHQSSGAPVRTDVVDLAPIPDPSLIERAIRSVPWWVLVPLLALLCARWPEAAGGLAAFCVTQLWIDIGVVLVALFIGMLELHARRTRPAPAQAAVWIRRAHAHPAWCAFQLRFFPWERRAGLMAGRVAVAPGPRWALGSLLGTLCWIACLLMVAVLVRTLVQPTLQQILPQWAVLPVVALLTWVSVVVGIHLLVRTGRQRLWAGISRIWRYEFWPWWVFYLPLLPWLAWLSIRYRGVLTWTCANPGVPMGGGIIGESKANILQHLESVGDEVLAARLVTPGGSHKARAAQVAHLVETDDALGGWPVILKPDSGFRGYAVRLVDNQLQAESYCRMMPRAFVVQRFHPGPEEVGVLWHRSPNGDGIIYAVTTKRLPTLRADGVRTRERLVLAHPRHRMQADIFLQRMGVQRDTIDPPDSVIRLGNAGNHAQGARFGDGADLATPELIQTLTRLANGFPDLGFDFGRFDLRCTHLDDLSKGCGIGVVELNGTTSEATNLYDPNRSLLWSYRVLFGQWAILYRIGAHRRNQGVQPVRMSQILRGMATHYQDRPMDAALAW